jgi:hypothetical protein
MFCKLKNLIVVYLRDVMLLEGIGTQVLSNLQTLLYSPVLLKKSIDYRYVGKKNKKYFLQIIPVVFYDAMKYKRSRFKT